MRLARRRRKPRNTAKVKRPDSLAGEYRLAGALVGIGVLGLLLLGERNLHVLCAPVGRWEALIALAYALCAFLIGLAVFVITDFRPDPPRSFLGIRRNRRLMAAGRVLGYAIWMAAITVGVAALFTILPRRRWWNRNSSYSDWLVQWRLGLAISSAFAAGVIVDASGLARHKWLRFFSLSRTPDWCGACSPFWTRLRMVAFVLVALALLCLWVGSWFDIGLEKIVRELRR